jgi:leucyl-tRNA synthetase
MKKYDFKTTEAKWQKIWEIEKTFAATEDFTKPKFYGLIEFPYPSGAGLHVGHPRSYTAMDVICRYQRMKGKNVLFPIGFDAFGLPAENYAMKNHVHPAKVTRQNIHHFTRQLKALGYSFDWDRVVDTTDPEYYKWTQWIFIQLYKHGLAQKKEMNVNWCTNCKVVLANEEVVNGVCERCGGQVIHKVKSQWVLKITDYADKLVHGLEDLDFIDPVKIQQRNWIGRSEGAMIKFATTLGDDLEVYTTRPDTIFGATYMVISPEHNLIEKWKDRLENYGEIEKYRAAAAKKNDMERTELNKEKTGVQLLGVKAINPLTGKEIPIFTADYVLATYGTGAIMSVPAHDSRDWEFAKKFNLPIKDVLTGGDSSQGAYTGTSQSTMINSGFINGMHIDEAKKKVLEFLEKNNLGYGKVNYKLRDWIFSRQRYWGEPIPMIYCEKCGWQPMDEKDLPLVLPPLEQYEPTGEGDSPLARVTDWVNTTCPCCGGPARRETDTMPQWAGSSWYFIRYCDPHNDKAPADFDKLKYWMPVDWYNGGMEHTTLHLLYSRFWNNFLYDIGVVPYAEPYAKRTSHGMILGENGEKMSKSRGNVVNPDDVIEQVGADTFRLYEMFMGDFTKTAPWSRSSIKGCARFQERVWGLLDIVTADKEYSKDFEKDFHRLIKKVSYDIMHLGFNTAIAAMMEQLNKIYDKGSITLGEIKTYIQLLNPFAPHMTEEMWQQLGFKGQIAHSQWPRYSELMCMEDELEIPVQVNGKLRGKVTVSAAADPKTVFAAAKAEKNVAAQIDGKTIVKEIYIQGRMINIVVK